MAAALGGLDALVFTGGVGEHAAAVRAGACDALVWIGLTLDDAVNATAAPDAVVSSPDSAIRVIVLHTREELMVARESVRVLGTP